MRQVLKPNTRLEVLQNDDRSIQRVHKIQRTCFAVQPAVMLVTHLAAARPCLWPARAADAAPAASHPLTLRQRERPRTCARCCPARCCCCPEPTGLQTFQSLVRSPSRSTATGHDYCWTSWKSQSKEIDQGDSHESSTWIGLHGHGCQLLIAPVTLKKAEQRVCWQTAMADPVQGALSPLGETVHRC